MLITCPICGARDVEEFTYWGDATVAYPALDASEEAWFNAVYQRENPSGDHDELWHHERGCRAFLKVRRNMTTHFIHGCELVGPFAGTESAT